MDVEMVTCPNCGSEVRDGMKFCSQCGRLMAETQSSASSTDSGNGDLTAGLAGGSGVAMSRSDSFGSSSEQAGKTQSDLMPQIAPPPPPRYDSRPPQYAPPPPPIYGQEIESGANSPPRFDQLPVPVGYAQPVIGFQCPNCRTNIQPLTMERVSQTGWIVLAVLVIVCVPLFWIGLLMKEPYRVCSQCGHTLS